MKKYHFNAFQNEKHFEKQSQSQSHSQIAHGKESYTTSVDLICF
jgi:hypothetical protein